MKTTRLLTIVLLILATSASAQALERSLYVLNSLAETLSRVNLETNGVSNNIQTLGLVPNQIYIDNVRRRDTIGYVVHSGSHDLWLVHLRTGAVVRTIALGVDRNPYALAFVDDSLVAVTNLLANSISIVNTDAGTVSDETPIGLSPEGVICHNGLLFVCITAFDFNTFQYGQGEIAVYDPEQDTVLAHIPVGMNPQAAVLDFDDQLLVLCTGDFFAQFGMLYKVDPLTFLVTDSMSTGGSPGHLALAPDGRTYIAAGGFSVTGEMYLYDAHTGTMLRDATNPIVVSLGSVGAATDILGNGYSCGFSADLVNRVQDSTILNTFGLGDGPGFAAVYEPLPPGDLDHSQTVTSADIIFLLNYVFKGGPPPSIPALADANRDCRITSADVVTLVNFVFKSGPHPRYGCY